MDFESGMELYNELKERYNGDLAEVYAYINNGIMGMMGRVNTPEERKAGEALYAAADFAQAEMVEHYMLEHGFYRPDPHINIWEKKA